MDFLRQTGFSPWDPLPDISDLVIAEDEYWVKPDALSGPGPRFLPKIEEAAVNSRWVRLKGNPWSFPVALRFGVPAIYARFDGELRPGSESTYPFGRLGPGSDDGIYVPSNLAEKYRENKALYQKHLHWHLEKMTMTPKATLIDTRLLGKNTVTVEDWHWNGDTYSLTVRVHSTGCLAPRENLVWFLDTTQSTPTPVLSYKNAGDEFYHDLIETETVISNAASDAFQSSSSSSSSKKRGADDDLDPGAVLPTKRERQ